MVNSIPSAYNGARPSLRKSSSEFLSTLWIETNQPLMWTALTLKSDSHIDILNSIKATMDVSKTYQHLGWRLSTARHMDSPHRLLTTHDIDSAFKAARTEQGSGRKIKKVAIEIVNTVYKGARNSHKQVVPALTIRSSERTHSAGSMHPSPTAPHYPLCTQDLQEWAKYLHETGDPDFVILPRTSPNHFNEIQKTQNKERAIRLPNRSRGLLRSIWESDEESDDDEPLQCIEDVLRTVHSRYPAMNFPQYADKLKDHGIFYLPTTAHFSVRFYEEKVGMLEGSAYTFQSCISKSHTKVELAKERRQAKGKKKAQARGNRDEENIPPSLHNLGRTNPQLEDNWK
ncbi:uncharacterized protein EDB91DRAFT_1087466 [Suillus paluster]|uniref:uncharacterized protein n=1 Tax=Suillus paluster TaxID=48578 RepID=UPI001B883B12|nr:uncharacterized protein EDB91DRAFT_1087466 [Suillus paluster]KAG1724456.1 hypothetical protein EDB91DRAFT_1087466 [Suillus paluster]